MERKTYLVQFRDSEEMTYAYDPMHAVREYVNGSFEHDTVLGDEPFTVYPVAHDADWTEKEILAKEVVSSRPETVTELARMTGLHEQAVASAIGGWNDLAETEIAYIEKATGKSLENLTLAIEYEQRLDPVE